MRIMVMVMLITIVTMIISHPAAYNYTLLKMMIKIMRNKMVMRIMTNDIVVSNCYSRMTSSQRMTYTMDIVIEAELNENIS